MFSMFLDRLAMFSQIIAAMYYYIAHLTALERITPPNCQVSQIERRLLQNLSTVITRQQVLIQQKFQ